MFYRGRLYLEDWDAGYGIRKRSIADRYPVAHLVNNHIEMTQQLVRLPDGYDVAIAVGDADDDIDIAVGATNDIGGPEFISTTTSLSTTDSLVHTTDP